ncbi:MAG: hypothetical protein AABM29_06140 [Actinomycetota bacterium]
MNELSLNRLAPLSGVLFLPLIIGAFLLLGETPDTDDPSLAVVEYWEDNGDATQLAALLQVLAAATVAWFGGCLRVALRESEPAPGRLSAVAFGGSLIAATGILIFAGVDFMLGETVGDVPPAVTHTFSVMDENFFFPVAGGFIIMLLATGVVAIRTGALPSWLGWVSLLIAVVMLTPAGFAGFLATLLWIPIVGVILYLREGRGAAARPAAPPAPPSGPGVTG